MRHLNYGHLYYFWSVAREGSIARASQLLHVTPQTISGQLKLLEDDVGAKLFNRQGRRLMLSDTGRVIQQYADEIFTVGSELARVVRGQKPATPASLAIGITDSVPKLVAYRVLEGVLKLPERPRIQCHEGKLEPLLAELAIHGLDMVLSDSPLPAGLHVRAYSHLLGKSAVSFLARPQLARRLRRRFPHSLAEAPLLLPSRSTALGAALEQWFDRLGVVPDIIGEFDDTALMKAFGQAGVGVIPVVQAIEPDVCSQYGLHRVGEATEVREHFYAISVERRIKHPAVLAITAQARDLIFAGPTRQNRP
jgi:LysR family transcriptional activator of nhaA